MKKRLQSVSGGVTAPVDFEAGAVACGIKPGSAPDRLDYALIRSRRPCSVAATFTSNRIKAAPVKVSHSRMRRADIRAVVVNSGNANACTGVPGIENAKRVTRAVAKALKLRESQVLACSTGRIGVALPVDKMETSTPELVKALSLDGGPSLARAIMTSDTFPKEFAVSFKLHGRTFRVGGAAKGAGMINPNMATMLAFVTTDLAVEKKDLQKALASAVDQSFNRITVDGDMSTNDTVIALANGAVHDEPILWGGPEFEVFQNAMDLVTRNLARMIVEDGEGTGKFVEVQVRGAATFQDARKAAEAVANSQLVKCAWAGNDPNWGRILDAAGYSGARVREELVDLYYDGVAAVRNGTLADTPLACLQKVVAQAKFKVTIDLHLGSSEYSVYTTDLTTRYVELNLSE